MNPFKGIILMIQFLTRIPIPITIDVKNEDFGKGLVYAPFVGLIIGGILAGFWYATSFIFPNAVSAVLLIVLYIVLTGGLHMDGLGDTFDGLFSNRSRERILEIMRDSRVGTNAVLAIVCVILMNVTLISNLPKEYTLSIILLMPVVGRFSSLISAGVSSYARKGEGLGKSFIECCDKREILLGLPFYLIIFAGVFLMQGGVDSAIKGLFLSLFPIFTAWLLAKSFAKKLDGVTGDILGAICELNQVFFLIFSYIFVIL